MAEIEIKEEDLNQVWDEYQKYVGAKEEDKANLLKKLKEKLAEIMKAKGYKAEQYEAFVAGLVKLAKEKKELDDTKAESFKDALEKAKPEDTEVKEVVLEAGHKEGEENDWEKIFEDLKKKKNSPIQSIEKNEDGVKANLKTGSTLTAKDNHLSYKYAGKPKADEIALMIESLKKQGYNKVKMQNVDETFAKAFYLAAKKAGLTVEVPEALKDKVKDWEQEAANASKGKGERKPEDKGDKSDKKGPEEEKVDAYKKEVLRIASRLSVTDEKGIKPEEAEALRKMIALSGLSADDILKDMAQDKETYKKLKPFIEHVVRSTAPEKGYKPEENKEDVEKKTAELADLLINAGKDGKISDEEKKTDPRETVCVCQADGIEEF